MKRTNWREVHPNCPVRHHRLDRWLGYSWWLCNVRGHEHRYRLTAWLCGALIGRSA